MLYGIEGNQCVRCGGYHRIEGCLLPDTALPVDIQYVRTGERGENLYVLRSTVDGVELPVVVDYPRSTFPVLRIGDRNISYSGGLESALRGATRFFLDVIDEQRVH